MTRDLDRDHFDALQDERAEHAIETGERMTLAEALRRHRQREQATTEGTP